MRFRAAVTLFLVLVAPVFQAAAEEVTRWNRIATETSAALQTDPLTESRIFAIMHASVHDALNAIERRYEPYRGTTASAPSASARAAVAAAAHASLVELMPSGKAAFDAALAETLAQVKDARSAALGRQTGRQAAAALLLARRDDGASRSVSRPAGTTPGAYRPTPPDLTPAAFAHWGDIRPFAMTSAAQFRPSAPLAPTSRRARLETEEVRAIGGKVSASRTAEQSEIARYWYEHSTQGWNRIAREVASARKLDDWESARLLALVNLAMADGFIAGFEAKYHYDYWRPATAIREGGDSTWLSDLQTPPVPDYPSTHTVLGAAAAAVLGDFFGTDFVPFSMTSGAPYAGITRRFWSFSEAAQENGASRVLAGVHFASAVRAGYEQGRRIGEWTVAQVLRPARAD
jgi:hypothetical protein